MVIDCSQAKVRGQRPVGSDIEWKQTDGQTDGDDCINSLANAFGNNVASGITDRYEHDKLQRVCFRTLCCVARLTKNENFVIIVNIVARTLPIVTVKHLVL